MQFCWLSELFGTAGAANDSTVGFETFALLIGVPGTGMPSLRSVTVIGAWKFAPEDRDRRGRRPGREEARRPGSGSTATRSSRTAGPMWYEKGTRIVGGT